MTLHITSQERRAHSALIRKHKDRLPKRIPRVSRERIEQAIEAHMEQADQLIRVLDLYDGDAADYEPALGSNGSCHTPERDDQSFWAYCTRDEREVDVADEPHDEMEEGNHEPWLAHTNDFNQERAQKHLGTLQMGDTWVSGGEDLEAEHDGREDDEREHMNEDGDDSDIEPYSRPEYHPEVTSFSFLPGLQKRA